MGSEKKANFDNPSYLLSELTLCMLCKFACFFFVAAFFPKFSFYLRLSNSLGSDLSLEEKATSYN